MNFDPSQESEVQGLHTALGALFVLLPIALGMKHPHLFYGSPRIIGSLLGVVFAGLKEFIWDQEMESPAVRGSNLRDFSFYIVGITAANIVLWL